MKNSKLIQTVQNTVNSLKKTSTKVEELNAIKFAGRPGRAEAEKIRDDYFSKIQADMVYMPAEKLQELGEEATENYYTKVAGKMVISEMVTQKHWNKYSKSWHRSYGPAVEKSGRKVIIQNAGTIPLDSFRGNWLLNACESAGILKPAKVPKRLKAAQMGKWFELSLCRKLNGFEIYSRHLAGELVNFVAVGHKTEYHAETAAGALKGLRQKIEAGRKARLQKDNEIWTAEAAAHEFGFCEYGIRRFAQAVGLNPEGEYSFAEIRKAVVENREAACEYQADLKKFGIMLNCK